MPNTENQTTVTTLCGTVHTLYYSETTKRWCWRGERGQRVSPFYKTAESAQAHTRRDLLV